MRLGLILNDPEEEHDCFSDNTHISHQYDAIGIANVYRGNYTRVDGSFVLEARIGDVLKLSGFMVSPAEIEATLLQFAGIEQCQVVGVQSERGPRAVAFVRCAGNFDEAAATATYVGTTEQAVQVSGTIRAMEPSGDGKVTVILETGDPLAGVTCEFAEADVPGTWRSGTEVSVKGICTGLLMDVVLVRCAAVE